MIRLAVYLAAAVALTGAAAANANAASVSTARSAARGIIIREHAGSGAEVVKSTLRLFTYTRLSAKRTWFAYTYRDTARWWHCNAITMTAGWHGYRWGYSFDQDTLYRRPCSEGEL